MKFSEAYEKYRRDIKVTALAQRVPGLDYDDVVSEMLICLWRASQTYKPGKATFGAYWWSLWLNRKANLVEAFNTAKRGVAVPTEDIELGSYVQRTFPEAPRGSSPQERMVWDLLGHGEPIKDVISLTRLSRRRYYDLIASWRTDEVREGLTKE